MVGSLSVLIFTNQIVSSSVCKKKLKLSYRTDSFGKDSTTVGAINCSNKTQHQSVVSVDLPVIF